MPELLLELLCEEIPARMQVTAAEALERLVGEKLSEAGLAFTGSAAFASPRRLALVVEGLPARQPDTKVERKGPKVGAPAAALEGFVRASALSSIEEAEVRETDKGPVPAWRCVIATEDRKATYYIGKADGSDLKVLVTWKGGELHIRHSGVK